MKVPIWISNRHIHLSQEDANKLFGKNYTFKNLKELSQPGQYAYKETVTAQWPKGKISNIRILWPVRKTTQLEILLGDQFILWVKAPLRVSGDLHNTPGIKLIGPKGETETKGGMIIAQRHLHISADQAKKQWLQNWQIISIKSEGPRSITFNNVIVRAKDSYNLDFHVDREEWNAAGLSKNSQWLIITN